MIDLHLSLLGIASVAEENGGSLPSRIIDDAEQLWQFSLMNLHEELAMFKSSRTELLLLNKTQLQVRTNNS